MTKRAKTIMACIMSFTLATSVLAPMPSTYAAKKIKLNKTKVSLILGKSTTLKIKGTKKKVKWSSSNKKVAIVTSKGKVTTKSIGSCKIKAKVAKKSYICKVTVKDKVSTSPSPSPSATVSASIPKGSTGTISNTTGAAATGSSTNTTAKPSSTPYTTNKPNTATTTPKAYDDEDDYYTTTPTTTATPTFNWDDDDWDDDDLDSTSTPTATATTTPTEDVSEKDANDVAALKALIAEQKALGATVNEDIDSFYYTWTDGKLTRIFWWKCNLQGSIDFGNLTNLSSINCEDNLLTNIDVSKNINLQFLRCSGNANLTSLDLKNNTNLMSLNCTDTGITTLNLSNCDSYISNFLTCDNNVTVTYPDGTTSVTTSKEDE